MYEYTQNYYDGWYRYPNPPWPIAGSPEQLDVDLDEKYPNTGIDFMEAWDEPQETPFSYQDMKQVIARYYFRSYLAMNLKNNILI